MVLHLSTWSQNNIQYILTRKQTWKALPHTVAKDVFWVVILIFDVYSLFFLSNFDSVLAKYSAKGEKIKRNASVHENTERISSFK